MATPTLTRHRLPGVLGEILIDVRAGGRQAPRPAVVVVHGFKGFKDWGLWPALADRLARAGFVAITFNLSGSGVDDSGEFRYPERFGHNTYSVEVQDLRRVIDALMAGELDVAAPSVLGLLGHSRGGGVAILQAAGDARIRALVTWAAIATIDRWPPPVRADWRARGVWEVRNERTGQTLPLYLGLLDEIEGGQSELDITGAAARIDVPWLLIHGSEDQAVDIAEGELLAGHAPPASSRFLRVEGAGHTFGAVHRAPGSPEHPPAPELELVTDATLAFFAGEVRER